MDDDARLIPEQGLPEAPSTIPLSWDFPQDAAERLEAACVAAEECAEACAAALQETDEEGTERSLRSAASPGSLRNADEVRVPIAGWR
jgi:hypothetical protein